VVGNEEEKIEETQHLATLSLCKNALMVLSVLGSVVSAGAADDFHECSG
jgi:hypothetical protein